MTQYKAPKFFTEQSRRPIAGPTEALHTLDRFRLSRGIIQSPIECCIVLTNDGHLELRNLGDSKSLPANLLNQLSFDEIATGGKVRELDVCSLHLLNVQMMEQPVDTLGLNDPIILHGTLSYAFGTAQEVIQGSLMVSRADFLDAIIGGAEYAFQYSTAGVEGRAARCFPLFLPGNRTESTRHGADLVLAYPLLPTDIIDKAPGNETLIQQMLYEVLTALQEDLGSEGIENSLRLEDLSALDREKIEQKLLDDGYVIDGDVAFRKKIVSNWQPLRDFIELLGPLTRNEVKLPYKHSLDELLALTSDAFAEIADWPPPSTVAIRSKYRKAIGC
ncbi:MAG: hypothetical protein JST89_06490 [Cyanobacteria bacterium SZAS-4]|nr:hypothetical protein [Cyanobacteria bacterium SZAS-4]